jgi:hypothetical protein
VSESRIVGLQPWLPWPLGEMRWWTEPVRAERLAALRIGVGAVLLADVLGHYLPFAHVFLGPGSLGGGEVFPVEGAEHIYQWSLVRDLGPSWLVPAVLWLWAGSGLCLLLGLESRVSAAVAWALAVSLFNANRYVTNAGDGVRDIMLFYLMLSPCGAVWSLDRWMSRDREGAVFVAPWALRLLFVQMAVIYFVGGAYKALFQPWRDGSAMYYHLANLAWTRLPYEWLPWPQLLVPAFTWITLAWELGFPVLVCFRSTRTVTLWLGVLFHIGTAFQFQIGAFPLYMLCFYLPLVPWERYFQKS